MTKPAYSLTFLDVSAAFIKKNVGISLPDCLSYLCTYHSIVLGQGALSPINSTLACNKFLFTQHWLVTRSFYSPNIGLEPDHTSSSLSSIVGNFSVLDRRSEILTVAKDGWPVCCRRRRTRKLIFAVLQPKHVGEFPSSQWEKPTDVSTTRRSDGPVPSFSPPWSVEDEIWTAHKSDMKGWISWPINWPMVTCPPACFWSYRGAPVRDVTRMAELREVCSGVLLDAGASPFHWLGGQLGCPLTQSSMKGVVSYFTGAFPEESTNRISPTCIKTLGLCLCIVSSQVGNLLGGQTAIWMTGQSLSACMCVHVRWTIRAYCFGMHAKTHS